MSVHKREIVIRRVQSRHCGIGHRDRVGTACHRAVEICAGAQLRRARHYIGVLTVHKTAVAEGEQRVGGPVGAAEIAGGHYQRGLGDGQSAIVKAEDIVARVQRTRRDRN